MAARRRKLEWQIVDVQEQTCETNPIGPGGKAAIQNKANWAGRGRLGCFHGEKTVIPLLGGRAIVRNKANRQEAARCSPSGPSGRGAEQTPRETKPIRRSLRVRRATRVKQTQLAHAWIAATRSPRRESRETRRIVRPYKQSQLGEEEGSPCAKQSQLPGRTSGR